MMTKRSRNLVLARICTNPYSLSYHFLNTSSLLGYIFCLLCRKQNDLSLSRPSWREDGAIAKVIRSQFLYPTAHPGRISFNCKILKFSNPSCICEDRTWQNHHKFFLCKLAAEIHIIFDVSEAGQIQFHL
jgi:hypothetical protein